MKTSPLLLSLIVTSLCAFNGFAEDVSEKHQREPLPRHKDLREYFKARESRLEEKLPSDEEVISAERKEALKSMRLKPMKRDKAIKKLEALAKEGDAESMRELGFWHEKHGDKGAAHAWYRKAGESGDEYSEIQKDVLEGKKDWIAGPGGGFAPYGLIRAPRLRAYDERTPYGIIFDREKAGIVPKMRMTSEDEIKAEKVYQEISK
jgi:hypothetical protein